MLIDTFLYEDQDGKQLYPQISITSKTIQSMSDNRITFAVVMSGAEIIVYSHVIVAKGRGREIARGHGREIGVYIVYICDNYSACHISDFSRLGYDILNEADYHVVPDTGRNNFQNSNVFHNINRYVAKAFDTMRRDRKAQYII